ncbi:hypothetical protein AcdelDRAFT_0454 [Acidovorax delafieldii 2AN]|uniref:Uncharacterized protein n=2 Tax=Acidovorax delafieldii TaxID=47920 RepID=C5T0M4_ACIDE|nr:hypothetical protein AcdelDRAFT_0454 [Acidovorax delafieldii 2AN]
MNGRTAVTAWIVDTSIEWDHQLFRGFLRISVNVTDHFDPS